MSDYISRETIKDAMLRDGFKAPDMTVTEFVEDELPAADVEPVRRSYWESYDTSQYMGTDEFGEPKWRPGRFYVCHDRRCRRKTVVKSNYFPSCGSKMDLEDGTDD